MMLELLDYRRTVAAMYQRIRDLGTGDPQAFAHFRTTRDQLFGQHTQSPLAAAQKSAFSGLCYYDYDPSYRVVAKLQPPPDDPAVYTIELGADGTFEITQMGTVTLTLPTGSGNLGVFWIEGYGGGVFLPFGDVTNGTITYGGGRYLYDTIKGVDLGTTETEMILDFNYAYHPSCYYNERWVCPLAPPQNRLDFAVAAGEQVTTSNE